MLIGHGIDVHKLIDPSPERQLLIIGGVKIEHNKVLEGHSDADVLIHSIMDALLGAAGLDDIGKHFPPDNEKYKNADSLGLLSEVKTMLEAKGLSIVNMDSTLLAEKPKFRSYIDQMKEKISKTLEIKASQVNIKATTTERLGFIGREEGIAADTVCLVQSSS